MIKLQKSYSSFVKGTYCSIEDLVWLKWLLILEKIGWNNALKRSDQHQRKETKLRTATKTTKLTLTSDPNCQSHFVKYATTLTLYNQFPKPIQEAEKYCAIVPKLKRYLFHKTLAGSLSNWKKITLSVVCGKRNV